MEVVKELVEKRGLSVLSVDQQGWTPLFEAARISGNAKCAAYLIEKKCDCGKLDKNRETALFFACTLAK